MTDKQIVYSHPGLDKVLLGEGKEERLKNLDNIPKPLKTEDRTIGYRLQRNEDPAKKHIKMPVPKMFRNDPKQRMPIDKVIQGMRTGQLAGLGTVTGGGITCIDFDDINASPERLAEVKQIIRELKSYTEGSISKNGVHIFVRGELPEGVRQRCKNIEIYGTGQFIALTGDIYSDEDFPPHYEVEERQEELEALHARYFPEPEENQEAEVFKPVESASDTPPQGCRSRGYSGSSTSSLDKAELTEVLEKLFKEKDGQKWKRIADGDDSSHGGDTSTADSALCAKVNFYTGNDFDRTEAVMRLTGRVRSKWDTHKTYLRTTIKKAQSEEVYNPQPSSEYSRTMQQINQGRKPQPATRLTEAQGGQVAEGFGQVPGDDGGTDTEGGVRTPEEFRAMVAAWLDIEDPVVKARKKQDLKEALGGGVSLPELTALIKEIEAELQQTKEQFCYSLSELEAKCEEEDGGLFLMPPLLLNRAITALGGDSGLGKSMLLYPIIRAVATGGYLDKTTTTGPKVLGGPRHVVLIQTDESIPLMTRRLRNLGLSEEEQTRVHIVPVFTTARQGYARLKKLVEEFKPSLIVADCLSSIARERLREENDAIYGEILHEMRRFCGANGPAWFLTHHSRKLAHGETSIGLGSAALRGSGAIKAAVDVVLMLHKGPTEDTRILIPEKRIATGRFVYTVGSDWLVPEVFNFAEVDTMNKALDTTDQDKLKAILKRSARGMNASTLRSYFPETHTFFSTSDKSIYKVLDRLKAQGGVIKEGKLFWDPEAHASNIFLDPPCLLLDPLEEESSRSRALSVVDKKVDMVVDTVDKGVNVYFLKSRQKSRHPLRNTPHVYHVSTKVFSIRRKGSYKKVDKLGGLGKKRCLLRPLLRDVTGMAARGGEGKNVSASTFADRNPKNPDSGFLVKRDESIKAETREGIEGLRETSRSWSNFFSEKTDFNKIQFQHLAEELNFPLSESEWTEEHF
jgi:primase-polymerase (primpol)-like protein